MKFRGTGGAGDKIELQMTPMIDVVFQLLIFFMLTFRIAIPEGDFNINMPLAAAQGDPNQDFQQRINVRLRADADGQLAAVFFSEQELAPGGSPDQMIGELRAQIRAIVGLFGAGAAADEGPQVEIDADYHLEYRYTVAAVTACSGELIEIAPGRYEVVKYIQKIELAPPRVPTESP